MLEKACKHCLGCNQMELDEWVEPEYCPRSPDPDRRKAPEQMRMEPVE